MKALRAFQSLFKRLLREENGASALEFSIVGSLLIFSTVSLLVFGIVMKTRSELNYAAGVAERWILLNPSASETKVEEVAKDAFQGGNDELLTVTAPTTTELVGTVSYRRITITYPVTLEAPGLPVRSFDIEVSRLVPMV
jgi:Flp pilus assembly protein TadG